MMKLFSRLIGIVFLFILFGLSGLMGFTFPSFTKKVPVAYVANGANNNIQVIDLNEGKTIKKIYSGVAPWRLISSPDGKQLWAQHWYSETTTVIDLKSHEIIYSLPFRGPGVFSPNGEQFLTMNWPSSAFHRIDGKSFKTIEQRMIDVNQVYDMTPDPEGNKLYMVQYDPMTKGPRERYGYMVSFPIGEEDSSKAVQLSYQTGRSPISIKASIKNPFLFTADLETSQLTLLNRLGDGRKVSSCPFPRTVILSKDETRMGVLCWKGEGAKRSHIISYQIDFNKRPWPSITEEARTTLEGGLVAGDFSPSGDRLYVLDRNNKRLLEIDPKNLTVYRSVTTGDHPMDVRIIEIPKKVRDQIGKEKEFDRKTLKEVMAKMGKTSNSFNNISWTEKVTWTEPGSEEKHGKTDDAKISKGVQKTKELKVFLKSPDGLRIENEKDEIRLAKEGTTISIDPDGKFWVTPRQDLISVVFSMPNLSSDEAIRTLAGDVPGSPYLRTGFAVDQVMEVKEGDHHYFVIGTQVEGERVSQLWVDAKTGFPTNLVEKFPVFSGKGHGEEGGFGGLVETKFYDYEKIDGGYRFPKRLERIIDGKLTQHVQIEKVKFNNDFSKDQFELNRLGGIGSKPSDKLVLPVKTSIGQEQPGRYVPSLGNDHLSYPQEPHTPYNSNPPTSGHHLPYVADWGIHPVPVPLELQVHNLEDGGVLVQYNCPDPCPDMVQILERKMKEFEHVILAPYPLMDNKIALTAWERIDTMDKLDEDRILKFIEAYEGIDHHAKEVAKEQP
ncbi:MAG TPA: DUF3105 domain-containing protein [Nitrospiria bacterium]|jgi:YVTN family beta-propeller protein